MVYEPREDSYLLVASVKKYAKGRTLDIGTGSGIQALAAKQTGNCTEVIAADIDEQAVRAAKEKGLTAVQSDLFENIEGTFETIICNAPYLPDHPDDKDPALDGGPKGYEWTIKFLTQAKKHLAREGQILLLISTRTNTHVVEEHLLTNTYHWEIIARKKIDFEELLVYNITWALPERPQATYLAKGKRSRVYLEGDAAIKVAKTTRIRQEAQMLKKVNELGIGPTYYSNTDSELVMEYIKGERIDAFLERAEKQEATHVIEKITEQLERLDNAGINKYELTNPYKHIIIQQGEPILIDFERAKHTRRPQNINQFKEYLKKHGH